MAKVELKSLVDRLNRACRMALEEAASICVASSHREVMIEHLLLALAQQPGGDIRLILQAYNSDPAKLVSSVKSSFDRFRQSDGNSPVFSPLLIELLQDAWLIASVELGQSSIRGGAILLAVLQDIGRFARFEYAVQLDKLPAEAIRRGFAELTKGSVETEEPAANSNGRQVAAAPQDESALARYAQCFTAQAREGKIDPVFCRDDEIRQIIDILARRRKNNPICVGEAGVGKTAVVEGLALKIVNGDVPDSLLGAEVYGLDIGALQAGASVKGEFEKRLKGVLDEVKQADRQTILFIDEAHTLIGAGGQAGGSDAANLLKPALARGEIKTIAATTWSEYKKYFEKDPALTRRFQLVKLDEPSVEQAYTILQGLVPAYEKAHDGVYISDEGVAAAVRLSARYITGRQLPDKAIDVLDTACARTRAAATGVPLAIEKLTRSAMALEREKEAIERDIKLGHDQKSLGKRLSDLQERLDAMLAEKTALEAGHAAQREHVERLKSLRAQMDDGADAGSLKAEIIDARLAFEQSRKSVALTSLEVGAVEIAAVIADWTGIPVSSMTQDEVSNLLQLSDVMGQTIKGQDHALKAIEDQLQASKLDLQRAGRPLGVFLLVGPSGVGKTETALEVARRLFGGEQFLTTVNMTEYQEKHSFSRLIGSPPGYVGYGEGGVLTEAIRKKPYSVVLLDEVEKADPDVLNLFYQAFDKGDLADGEGRQIDCKNVVFFLTSNLASEQITALATGEGALPPEEIEKAIRPLLAQHFKPALLARMQPIVYLPLGEEVMKRIIAAKLGDLGKMLAEKQGIALELTDGAVRRLEALCNETASGARLIDQLIQRRLLPVISRQILRSRLDETLLRHVRIDADDSGEFSFDFTAEGEALAQEAAE
ncbi:type VI secretion system ATPase TssH [Phyllobacterium leguminum]|uniref:Type VI secretion system protein VasG n=1 Tax=Phyllobacterium leguminum TaxID=314237 RepID=A0A318ST57_9HYPH|nr:type VI secretion system ATPase TssH [Phyllobacterium leguminum]PYE85151.1 type VI secretion system protein VasG [Phyllobacterium leguminum]